MHSTSPISIKEIKSLCPAAFHMDAHPNRSDRYVHLPTSQLIESMLDNGYGVSRAQQKNTHTAEAMNYTRHLLSFRPLDTFAEKALAGQATPEICLVSSHDGTTAFNLFVGMYVFICANGLMAGDTFASEKIYHRGDAADQMVDKSNNLVDVFVPKLNTWCKDAQSTELSPKQIGKFANDAMEIRFGEHKPFESKRLLDIRRPEDKGNNVWSVYNRVQENLMKGGIDGKTATGRRSTLRPINRVPKDVTYNQKLWDLASDYLEQAA